MTDEYLFEPSCQVPAEALDRIFKETFGFIKDGTFVECGGFDGRQFSNTWGLAKMGWRGLYIEPDPDNCALCEKEHGQDYPRIGIAMCAVGAEDRQPVTLHQAGYASSLSKPGYKESTGTVETTMRRLDTLLPYWLIKPGFELLVIDVEFHEIGVLQGFSLERWQPKLVIIELHETEEDNWVSQQSRPIAKFANEYFAKLYEKVHMDHVNSIFRLKKEVLPLVQSEPKDTAL